MVRDLVWEKATAVVWLNYSFPRVFFRALVRTCRRVITQEELFAGNREAFSVTDPDWIPWWVVRTYWRRRREYSQLLRQQEYDHLVVFEFSRPEQTEQFLHSCENGEFAGASR